MKSIACLTLTLAAVLSGLFAAEEVKTPSENNEKLFQLLSEQKLTIQDGIKKVLESTNEIPVAARFTLDNNGELVLRVLVTEKGFSSDVDQAGLKLYTTAVDPAKWKPESRAVNAEHLMRASECWSLMAVSRDSLYDILKRAEKDHHLVYAIGPSVRDGQAKFVMSVDDKGEKAEVCYDLKAKK